jgi:hypothetical protein
MYSESSPLFKDVEREASTEYSLNLADGELNIDGVPAKFGASDSYAVPTAADGCVDKHEAGYGIGTFLFSAVDLLASLPAKMLPELGEDDEAMYQTPSAASDLLPDGQSTEDEYGTPADLADEPEEPEPEGPTARGLLPCAVLDDGATPAVQKFGFNASRRLPTWLASAGGGFNLLTAPSINDMGESEYAEVYDHLYDGFDDTADGIGVGYGLPKLDAADRRRREIEDQGYMFDAAINEMDTLLEDYALEAESQYSMPVLT